MERGPVKPLPADRLRRRCELDELHFQTTDDLPYTQKIIGQDRAVRAIRLGLAIHAPGYNVFVVGHIGTGRNTTINRFLEEAPAKGSPPPDLAYVHNFKEPDSPRLLVFAAGRGSRFRDAVHSFVAGLKRGLPRVFDSDEYGRERRAVLEGYKERQKDLFRRFEDKVEREGFRLEQVQMGPIVRPTIVPLIGGEPAALDRLEEQIQAGKLTKEEANSIEERHDDLVQEMEQVLKEARLIDQEAQVRIERLDIDLVMPLIHDPIAQLRTDYREKSVDVFLDELEEDMLIHLDRFREKPEPAELPGMGPTPPAPDQLLEYRVNLIVDNAAIKGPPVVSESFPSYKNLFGAIERTLDRVGEGRSHFTQIKAGSYLRANGGYLVLNAEDVLSEMGVWSTLKRTLRTGTLEIQSPDSAFAFSTSMLKPEPIECDVKVVMVGDHNVYRALFHTDSEFRKIFKVKAEFDTVMKATPDNIHEYATFIRKITGTESLRPFDRSGASSIVEWGMREAGRGGRLSSQFTQIADVIREASWWATQHGAAMVSAAHVDEALAARRDRVSLSREKMFEAIADGSLLLDVTGARVGQINGLVVYEMGDHEFGVPSRITASLSMGRAGIVNIEREVDMSGPTHDKGVLILAGYLRLLFAQDRPLTLSASLAFEQSYGSVDGDSASSAEMYALLSALASAPIRQGMAVTGSVNQMGEIQPIGGVNEKIEGWFAACGARGDLTGEQGVLIPALNVDDLMLEPEVVEAVRAGRFSVYPVATIAEGIELLTGIPAGERRDGSRFTEGSIFDRSDRRLEELARKIRDFGPAAPERL